MKGILIPPNHKQMFTWRNMIVVTNLASQGANTTFALYVPAALAPAVIGLNALYANSVSTSALYGSMRVLAAKVRANITNQEAFGLRVAIALGASAPANNTLSTQTLQQPIMSRTGSMIADKNIGPLTGNSMTTLTLQGSNVRTLGVRNVKGLADPYTNYFDTATNTWVAAVNGLTLVVLVYSAVNLTTAGVLCDIEVDLFCEFFSPNPTKTG